ncbi:hypothetical protein AND_007059 [Anopheles darlingi]|uniref:TFIIS N-terminal domain-containing protein n=1 Tax=Anopheles darlingi TaxID=43151 RepID=W5JA02_ANODA|nr:hypothetical protein AND_007059 [Anopheles darlingi]
MASGEFVSDFDAMLSRKKQNRKRAVQSATPSVDEVPNLLAQMMEAAIEDRKLLHAGQLPTQKLLLLDSAISKLMKRNLQQLYLEHGLLSVLTVWLSPSSNGHPPPFQIREAILTVLQLYDCIRKNHLKESGLGKQIYRLAKDPQELRKNRKLARTLVTKWARDIFGISVDYRSMSRAERLEHDMKAVPGQLKKVKKEQHMTDLTTKTPFVRLIDDPFVTDQETSNDPPVATTIRARVPMVSTKEYIIRPASKLADEGPHHQSMATMMGRCDRMIRNYNKKRGT